jgi:hypothetical protein
MFALVKPNKPTELDLDEFIKLSFNSEANQSKSEDTAFHYYYLVLRKIVKDLRKKFLIVERSSLNYTRFIPYSFPALLSYLSFQEHRSTLVQEIHKTVGKPRAGDKSCRASMF